MTILYVLLALLLLGILITVHEFGHFIAARACGIEVKEFSIGFGPKLWQHTCKTGMLFSLRPIPLGGYCMFYGDTDDDPDGKKQDDPRCFNKAAVWKRMLTVLAGPLMNFVLAFVVAVFVMGIWGTNAEVIAPYLVSVSENSPAERAGLMAQDEFISLNGQSMEGRDIQAWIDVINQSEGNPIDMVIRRGDEQLTLSMTPEWSEQDQKYMVGVTISNRLRTQSIGFGGAIPAAWQLCREASVTIVKTLGQIFTSREVRDGITGPVGTIQVVAELTQTYGFSEYLYLMIVISVNLGLMNLLPIPGLDGSRIIFNLIEMIFRRPVNQKVESIIHLCGYALLLVLMLVITGKDILNLFH